MTKKPSEKNKAWEKERRDRLNKSFESLAKLLPNYDPSIVWTKIEIIQKSILYIEVLQQRNKKYLASKDPQELKKYNELLDAIKYYQLRNGQLSELLKKSKITLPPFNLPKFLCDNTKLIENNEEDQNDSNKCEKSTKEINENFTGENLVKKFTNNKIDSNQKLNNKNVKIRKTKQITENKKSNETKSKTVRTVTVTSTVKPDVVISEDVQNDIPLSEPIPSSDNIPSLNQSIIKIPTNAPIPSTVLPVILPTLIKIENLPLSKKNKNTNSNQIIRKIAKDQNGKIKILPQPHLKLYYRRADGKMPIPVIRKKVFVPVKKRKPRKRKVINNDETCDTKKIKLNENDENVENENVNNDANSPCNTEKKIVDKNMINLDLLNVERNNRTVSPTAAFLESFPVVASTTNPSKLCETQNIPQLDVSSKVCEISRTTESNAENLENLNNFFATKEYSNYCAQSNEKIAQDPVKLEEKKLDNKKQIIELQNSNNLKRPEIQILENIKIEMNKTDASQQAIKTDQVTTTILNKTLVTSSVGIVSTTNISNSNSLFTTFTSIAVNPSTFPTTAYSSTQSTLNLINYISTPSTFCPPTTQFLSSFPEFPSSIVRQTNIKRNSCKFNLSTKGPICTPLPLDSKNLFTQNYSNPNNCGISTGHIPKILPPNSYDNDNIFNTSISEVNTNTLSVHNMPKTFINTSLSSVNSENIVTAQILPYNIDSTELQDDNKSLSTTTNSNFMNYQTSFENFNMKTYSASSNVAPETHKKSKVSKTNKFSNSAITKSKISSNCTSAAAVSISSSTSNSTNFHTTISNSENINSSTMQSYSNPTPTSTISDIISSLSCSKAINIPLNSVKINEKSADSPLKTNLPHFNPVIPTFNSVNNNNLNTTVQSDKIDIKFSSGNFVKTEIITDTYSNLTYSQPTNSSISTNVKYQPTKFHPYSANFAIPTTTVTIPKGLSTIYLPKAENVSNYPPKPFMNPASSKNQTFSSTIVTYTSANSIALTSKLSDTLKVTTTKLNYPLVTKSIGNTNYQPYTATLASNIMPSSANTPITTSQFLLRPYDFATNTTTSIISTTTASNLPYTAYRTTKQTILPASTQTFSTCTSSASNFTHATYTNLTTVNNNNFSVANSIYPNPSKNYFYPLQNDTSTTFSFSLTTTTNSQIKPLVTPQTQPSFVYPKTEMPPPWLPQAHTPTNVTAEYKTPFTFSLTPTSAVSTTSITTKSSQCVLTSTSTSTHLINNSQIPLNSYNSATNFTFCLTTPKSAPPTETGIQKFTPNIIPKNYQTNLPTFNTNFDSQLNFNQKNTTNFTFALTKSTHSVSDSSPAPIISNNKIGNLYANNEINLDNKNNQDTSIQNSASAPEQFKISTNKVKTTTQKLNKKNINEQNYYDCVQNKTFHKVGQKSHVNWMTSSSENTQISKITPQYFPTQNNESIFPWSQNKIYDNLQQTYYGDTNHYPELPINSNQNPDNTKFFNNNVKVEKFIEPTPATSSTNQSNFFSVSQLVDQTTESSKNFTNIQNFNNQNSCQHSKISPIKTKSKDLKIGNPTNSLINLDYSEEQREQKPLTISNTYSAEALISKKEKHRNFNTTCNNNITNPTDFYSSSIDPMETIIPEQNNYHTNNYFYNYHHQQSINQNYPIQSEIDYLASNNINSYENDKKLYPPSSYPAPIPPPPPTCVVVSSLSSSNTVNTNPNTFLPYDTNYGHIQYYHGTPTTNSAISNNYQTNNWTKGLQYTNSSCVVPQYHHNHQTLPIIGDHHGQSTINSQTVTGNLTNFNLSSICPEINDKVNTSGTNNEW